MEDGELGLDKMLETLGIIPGTKKAEELLRRSKVILKPTMEDLEGILEIMERKKDGSPPKPKAQVKIVPDLVYQETSYYEKLPAIISYGQALDLVGKIAKGIDPDMFMANQDPLSEKNLEYKKEMIFQAAVNAQKKGWYKA